MDDDDLTQTELAVSAQESSHDNVRAIDPIGGDLSIKLDRIG